MEGEKALTRIGKGSAVIITGLVMGSILEYVLKAFLARFLGPSSYGVFIQGYAVATALGIFALFGLQMSIPRFLSYYKGEDRVEMTDRVLNTSLYIVLISSVLFSAVIYSLSDWLAGSFFQDSLLVEPLKVFGLSIIPLSLFYLAIAFFRGEQNARYKVYLKDLLFPVLQISLLSIFFLAGYELMGAVYAFSISVTLTMLTGLYLYKRTGESEFFSGAEPVFNKLLVFSWPLFVISVMAQSNKWFDVIMLGWVGESAQAGIYEVAFAVAGFLGLIVNSVSYMFMPVISELYGEEDESAVAETYIVTTRWVFVGTLPLFAGMMIFPEEILTLLFGSSYSSGANPMRILAAGFILMVFSGLAQRLLLSIGKTRMLMVISLATGVTNIVLNLVLIPAYGMKGAAFSITAAFLVGFLMYVKAAKREIGVYPFNRRFTVPIGSIIMSSSTIYIVKAVLKPGVFSSVLLGAILVSVYLSLIYLLGGTYEEDWMMLEELWEGFMGLLSRTISG